MKLKMVKSKFKNCKEDDIFCISAYEHYFSYITLKDFLLMELSKDDLINIFFQILFSYSYFIYKNGRNFFDHEVRLRDCTR